jgi:isohexenylglutaconyl-CoA hydratase
MVEAKNLLIATLDGVRTITLNRPQARNAMTLEMLRELIQAFREADETAALRVLVVRGSGGHFSAGADVKDFARARTAPVANGIDPVMELSAAFGHVCTTFAQVSLPTVCVLEGAVLGGGFGLACASDVTLAEQGAVFGLPETSLGILPAQIAPFLVERLGYSQAKRLSLLGGRYDAATALQLGLVHEVCAGSEALESALNATLLRFLACAPEATRATKRLLLRTRDESAESLIEPAAAAFAAALSGPEGEEGTRAFIEKRRPSWHPSK